MKVNISYAVELGDIPEEVDKLLGDCEDKFRNIHGTLDQISSLNPLIAMEDINGVRISLDTIDLRLADCLQILSGYIELLNKIETPQHEQNLNEEVPHASKDV